MSRSKRLNLSRLKAAGRLVEVEPQLVDPAVFLFLTLDVLADHFLVRPTVDTKYPRAQKWWPRTFRLPSNCLAMWIVLFPLINPITCATEYFGGIEISMCT